MGAVAGASRTRLTEAPEMVRDHMTRLGAVAGASPWPFGMALVPLLDLPG